MAYDPELEPALRRHRQRHVRGTGDLRSPAAATISISPRSSRSIPTPASTSGTTRRRPARPGTTRRRSRSCSPTSTIGGRARSRHAGAEERLLLRARSRRPASCCRPRNSRRSPGPAHVDMTTGRPVENPGSRYEDKGKPYVSPGALGMHNWHPMAFSPKTGLVYIPAQDNRPLLRSRAEDVHEHAAGNTTSGTSRSAQHREVRASRTKAACSPGIRSRANRNGPSVRRYWNGGTLATAGNLVFQGTADGNFIAYNASTGEKLWSVVCRHRYRRTADHLFDRRQAIRFGDGGLGRRVSKEVPQLRPVVDLHDRRHRAHRSRARRPWTRHGDTEHGAPRQTCTAGRETLHAACVRCHGSRRCFRISVVRHRRCSTASTRSLMAQWSSAACRDLQNSIRRRSRS